MWLIILLLLVIALAVATYGLRSRRPTFDELSREEQLTRIRNALHGPPNHSDYGQTVSDPILEQHDREAGRRRR